MTLDGPLRPHADLIRLAWVPADHHRFIRPLVPAIVARKVLRASAYAFLFRGCTLSNPWDEP
jgi:hypothetical protein